MSSFGKRLKKDGFVTIHKRNFQVLVTEMFKITEAATQRCS